MKELEEERGTVHISMSGKAGGSGVAIRFARAMKLPTLAVLTALVSPIESHSAEPQAEVGTPSPARLAHFPEPVASIFARHCQECHSQESSEVDLSLQTLDGALRGSERGSVLVPGDAKASLLVQVLAEDTELHMPPDGQLSEAEMSTITTWVESLDPEAIRMTARLTAADRKHWAFQPLGQVAVPEVQDRTWLRTPVDAFILARLESEELTPSPAADRAALIRRVYFDLVGLPPSPDEVQAFVQDSSSTAYERVVDRLLASPRYGERWGRHWLDLARYADSGGFHNDIDRPNAWRYRDYVINSFNSDKPYGEFLTEQIAGDALDDATLETWIATGFCRNGPSNDDNMGKTERARRQYRMDELDDIVSTTANVFLGLTIGCARCHDHKYDPLSQRDYYQFVAFFANARRKQLTLTAFDPSGPELKPVPRKPDDKTDSAMVLTDHGQKTQPTHILWRGDVRNQGPVVAPSVPAVFAIGSDDGVALQSSAPQSSATRLDLADWIASPDNPLTWRVLANRLWHYHFGRGLVDSPSNFGRRGAPPTHPGLLDWLADQLRADGGRLKAIHRLIVTSAVYRQQSQSSLSPSSPAHLSPSSHRLAVDPNNRLWWRMDKRRLEAEPLRDAILAVSGTMNLASGGPGIKPRIRAELLVASQRNKWPVVKQEGPEHWRRSVYVYVKRQLQLPMLELFDAPSSNHSCARRDESLVPTQALVLLNDDFVRQQAAFMAQRVRERSGEDFQAAAQGALELALSRAPPAERVTDAVAFLEDQAERLIAEGRNSEQARLEALTDLCHVLMNLSEFAYVD